MLKLKLISIIKPKANRSDRRDQFVTTLLQNIHNKMENELTENPVLD